MDDGVRVKGISRSPLNEFEELCTDGCGLSARECCALHARLVAYVRARLLEPYQPGKESHAWPKAA